MPLTFFATIIVIVGVFLLIAFLRRGTVASQPMGSRIETFTTAMEPDAVFDTVARGFYPFKHEDSDRAARAIVLATSPTFATWGFFFPVHIEARPGGGSIVRVGIRSKLFQWGPLVTRWHLKCTRAIEQAVNAELPAARVVG